MNVPELVRCSPVHALLISRDEGLHGSFSAENGVTIARLAEQRRPVSTSKALGNRLKLYRAVLTACLFLILSGVHFAAGAGSERSIGADQRLPGF